jgi:hypothetical protein
MQLLKGTQDIRFADCREIAFLQALCHSSRASASINVSMPDFNIRSRQMRRSILRVMLSSLYRFFHQPAVVAMALRIP